MSGHLSVVLHGKNDLRLEETPVPELLNETDLLLKTNCCGICGTDIHMWESAQLGDFVLKEPLVLGHEGSATVVQVGSKVTNFKPGDQVTIEPVIPCRDCQFCLEGNYNLCDICYSQAKGLPPCDGMLRTYFTHPALFCYKYSNKLSPEEGAFTEPLACAVHGVKRAGVSIGQNVLICGSGTIGLLTLLTVKAFGAGKVIISDTNQKRLALAKSLGADETILVTKESTTEDFVAQVEKYFDGDRANVTLECTGVQASVQCAIMSTRAGGRVAIVGLGPENVSIPLVKASLREVDLIGVCRFRNDFPLAVHLLDSGKVNVKPLITHKFNIEDALEAFKTVKRQDGIKVMITFN